MKAEIQLRTIAMDSWASLEHQLRYKKENAFDAEMADEIRACAELSALLDEKMNRLKRRIDANPQNERNRVQSELDRFHSMMGDLPASSSESKENE